MENGMKFYEAVSSVLGSLYCGYSRDKAEDAFTARWRECLDSGFATVDNLGLYEGGETIRVYWGGASPSVHERFLQIQREREEDNRNTFFEENRPRGEEE